MYKATITSKTGCPAVKQPYSMISVFDTLHDTVDWVSNTIRFLARECGGLHYDVKVVIEIDTNVEGW